MLWLQIRTRVTHHGVMGRVASRCGVLEGRHRSGTETWNRDLPQDPLGFLHVNSPTQILFSCRTAGFEPSGKRRYLSFSRSANLIMTHLRPGSLGSQSSQVTSTSGTTIGWHTTYTWVGGPSNVKSCEPFFSSFQLEIGLTFLTS